MKITKEMKKAGIIQTKKGIFFNDCFIELPQCSDPKTYIEKTVLPLIAAGYSLFPLNQLYRTIEEKTGHTREAILQRYGNCALPNIIHQVCVNNWFGNEWCKEEAILKPFHDIL